MHFTAWKGNISYLDKESAALNDTYFVFLVLSLLTKISACFSVKVESGIISSLKTETRRQNNVLACGLSH